MRFARGPRFNGGIDTGTHQPDGFNGALPQRGAGLSLLPPPAPHWAVGISYSLHCASCLALPPSPGTSPAILHPHIGKLRCERAPPALFPSLAVCAWVHICIHMCMLVCVSLGGTGVHAICVCVCTDVTDPCTPFACAWACLRCVWGLYLPVCPPDGPRRGEWGWLAGLTQGG